jgi:glucokinase
MKKSLETTVLGVDIGGTSVRFGVVDKDGNLLWKGKEGSRAKAGPNFLVSQMELLSERASKEYGVVATGIGFPGVLDQPSGFVVVGTNIGWRRVPFRQILERSLSVPFVLENDANAALLGEEWLGEASRLKDVVLFTVGTGIGGGLLLNGELYRGAHGGAGGLGHILINPGGPACAEGHPGCFEAVASAKAVADGRASLSEAARHWGRALFSYQRIFDPEVFLFSGGGVEHPGLFKAILGEARRNGVVVPIKRGSLGEWSGVLGAARLAWDSK